MKEDLGFTEKINAELFRRLKEAVISEMEDLADLSSNLRKRLNLQIQKPFAVVSVNSMPQEESGHEASRAMYDEGKALRFLQKEIESGSKFTSIETLRTAVSAFLCLFQRELAADEILVSVLDEGVFPVNVKICNHGEDLAVIRPPGNPADVFTVQRPSK